MSYSAAELNELLARSLGTNPYGEGLFRWERSEDLFWPEFPTGRKTTKMVEVPIIGGGVDLAETVVPEYRSEPMCPKLDRQWVVTLWYPPESLDNWQAQFPGAAYPSRGYRIATNASLPRFPGGHTEPTIADTEFLIAQVREQRSMAYRERLADMEADRDRKEAATASEIEDEVRDEFNAFMNPTPGKRGGFVSLPQPEKPASNLIVLP